VWTQQGDKLVGTGAVEPGFQRAHQGKSVALSADGNTLIIGGYQHDSSVGAAWVFTRDGNGVWTQQGNKLVGTGATGVAPQGYSVALTADGNTAIVGGPVDDSVLGVRTVGAAWVFRRVGGVWSQWGQKLVGGGGGSSIQRQGYSVARSGEGGTVVLGGAYDNYSAIDGTSIGAAWIFGNPKLYEFSGSRHGGRRHRRADLRPQHRQCG